MNTIKKHATLVDFLNTDVQLGNRDGEVIVTTIVRLQLEKFDICGLEDLFRQRFPFISKNGVFKTVGKAVCGNETFDFEKGKNIAETRAQMKAYRIAAKVMKVIELYFIDFAKTLDNIRTNNENCADKCNNHINYLDN